jgi:hypothetical protein
VAGPWAVVVRRAAHPLAPLAPGQVKPPRCSTPGG